MSSESIELKNVKTRLRENREPERQVGILLGLGVFFFPIIFAWGLLRAGYSSTSRFVGLGWLIFVTVFTLISPAVTMKASEEKKQANDVAPAAVTATAFKPLQVEVRADPGVEYIIFDVVKRLDNLIEVSSRRKGSSGISYAKRLVNCQNWTFKYLAEGDTAEELMVLRPDPTMATLTQGSSSTVISYNGCKAAGFL